MSQQVKNQARAVLTGMFIVIGIAALVLSLFITGDGLYIFQKKFYLESELLQAQGITSGSLVALNGVSIGNVTQVSISPQDVKKIIVTMEIDSKFENKIPQDSFLELKTQGALGDKYIQITPGQSSSFLQNKGQIQAIASKDILDLISEKGGEAQKVFFLIDETLELLKSINANGRVAKILNHSETTALELAEISKDLKLIIKNFNTNNQPQISQSLTHLNSILTKIDQGQGTLGALINDPSLHQQIKKILKGSGPHADLQNLFNQNLEFSK